MFKSQLELSLAFFIKLSSQELLSAFSRYGRFKKVIFSFKVEARAEKEEERLIIAVQNEEEHAV